MPQALKNDADADSNIRMKDVQCTMAPDGPVAALKPGTAVNDKTTYDIMMANYRQSKFVRTVSDTKFEDLQEVVQDNGDTMWVAVQTIDNVMHSFYMSKAEIMGSIVLTEVANDAEAQAVAKEYDIQVGQTYIEIDGKRYFVNMSVPMHFGTGDKQSMLMQSAIFILGDSALGIAVASVVKAFGADAFKNAVKELGSAVFTVLWGVMRGIVTGIYRFLVTLVSGLVLGADIGLSLRAAASAAGDAWAKSVEKITARRVAYAFAGVVIMVGVCLFMEFVLHSSFQNVYIYNLTKHDMAFDTRYVDEGKIGDVPTKLIKKAETLHGPGGINLGTWYNGAAFRFESDSQFHGLGYALQFQLLDEATQNPIKDYAVMFDIPFSGKNSLAATTDKITDFKSFYKDNEGKNKVTQYSVSDDKFEIIVTYDFLDGQHDDPETGQKVYLYSSLVVIRDKIA